MIRRRRHERSILIASLLLLGGVAVSAQDAHHWHKQYGNRAYLLGGAVIGSTDDVSAIYYNPALLTAAENLGLEVAGNAYHLSEVTLTDALGTGEDLTTTYLGVAPALVAGEIAIDDDRRHRLAYGLLFRHDFNVVLELRGPVDVGDLLGEANARLGFEENVNEVWSGLGYARRLGDRLSLGASVFATYRTHRSRRAFLTASDTVGEYGVAVQRDDFDYTHAGLLAKVGLGGRWGFWRYGVSLTTPTLHLTGTGTKSFDRILAAVDPGSGGLLEYLATGTERDIPADYRTPLAVGVGTSYRIGRTEIHLAAEWFDALEEYRLLDTTPVAGTSNDRIDYDLRAASRSVINWGVGLEHRFSSLVNAYASYHTDRSTVDREGPDAPLAIWDIHHYAAGISLDFDGKRVAIGVVHATGSDPVTGAIDLVPGILDELGTTSVPQEVEARYRSTMLLLGFNVDY